MSARRVTAEDGQRALRDHVVERALIAREKYGEALDPTVFATLLEDREIVRYPTTLAFDASPLQPGEFAHAEPLGARPADGFRLVIHPRFADRPEVLPLLAAYHLVTVNYGDIVSHEEAELFGSTLLGLEVDDYYTRLCALADELGAPPGDPS